MALAEILEEIRRETLETVERLVVEGRQQHDAILAEAEEKAAEHEKQVSSSRDEETADTARAMRSRAHLEVARSLRKAKEHAFQTALEQVRERFAAVRDLDRYPEMFRDLVEECRTILPTGNILRVDPRDHELAVGFCDETDNAEWEIEPVLSTWGGAELHTADGRRALNTLEERLERAGASLRQVFADRVPSITGGRQ